MAVVLSTDPGGIFRRIGRTTFGLESLKRMLADGDLSGAGIASLGVMIDNIQGQFAAADQSVIDGLYSNRDSARQSAFNAIAGYLASTIQNGVVSQVNDDTPVFPSNLTNALTILIAQMKGASQSIKGNAVSAATSVGGSNVGNSVIRASVIGPGGHIRQYVYPEPITFTYVTDSQSGATAGSESLSVTSSAPATAGLLGWDFPGGSGLNTSATVNDPANGQIVTDGPFEQWSGVGTNTLTNWTADAGAYGTGILRETTIFFRGLAAVKFLSDGSTLLGISQPLALQPLTVYALNLWIKMSATPSAGALSVDLFNGTSIVQDDAGANNQITQALTSVSTSWVAIGGYFRTPSVMPATMRLRIRLTTAIDTGKSLYFDDLGFLAPTNLYQGGPYAVIFPGNVPSIVGDFLKATISNDLGGKLQTGCWRLLGMPQLGLQIPYVTDSSETVGDSLVY